MEFTAIIFQKGNNLGIEVPEQIINQLGAGKKPAVVVSIGDYSYRSTVAVMQGKYLIPLSSAHRKFVKVDGGDRTLVNIHLDNDLRIPAIPDSLATTFEENVKARDFFESLPPSAKKKTILLINSAKTDETRRKRLDKVTSQLSNHIRP